jgi:flagellar protein FliL
MGEGMSAAAAPAVEDAGEPPRGGKKKLILISVVLALVGAGGGYFGAGMLSGGSGEKRAEEKPKVDAPAPAAFVPIDPIVVSLGATGANRHLSFRAQLEVPPDKVADVAGLMPRIVDVLNSYLRAVDVREFDSPHGLIRLRAQMLRRVQLIVGDGKVNDLLVMEFVLN